LVSRGLCRDWNDVEVLLMALLGLILLSLFLVALGAARVRRGKN
jgi:hypothetical protein